MKPRIRAWVAGRAACLGAAEGLVLVVAAPGRVLLLARGRVVVGAVATAPMLVAEVVGVVARAVALLAGADFWWVAAKATSAAATATTTTAQVVLGLGGGDSLIANRKRRNIVTGFVRLIIPAYHGQSSKCLAG
jgi:hypothetical protein